MYLQKNVVYVLVVLCLVKDIGSPMKV